MKDFAPLFALTPAGSTLTGLDWLVIAALLRNSAGRGHLGGAQRKGLRNRLLPGRTQSRLVGDWRFDFCVQHRFGTCGGSGRSGRHQRRRHGALRAPRLGLLLLGWVFVPFYMRSKVFTMPEFLERRFSVQSRYVLSIVSIVTFIVTKIAVGIFAGGVVFGTLFPECDCTCGRSRYRQLLDRLGGR